MGDVNLPDYEEDFAELWEALFAAPHDVLIVSGDIHWSRFYTVSKTHRELYEIISSALSRIEPGHSPSIQNKVEWNRPDGLARSEPVFVDDHKHTYATLSFTPTASVEHPPMRVDVRWWGVSEDPNLGPQLIGSPVTRRIT